ncbi:T1SS-143 repeat domain-containing protein [Rhizobium rosettiformans]|uniref:T1SS-143 repeat domain-containing protein n=1 Tax=Rhizobium rosettiformans TaxID=1368430 RepID=UPI0028629DCF|nr:DUF5801 repeats-in-toxin domain-containing protein [Rhizobium rosettiformans]MDR7028491.1 T1SS-143 domain-containing protein [Rhizobium rosettiformans]MDR7064227.1 T1SS-143 domain-containing protein [Rhizobium rosettiformans]
MSIEDPRLSSIDNTSAADDFDSAVEQHLGFASETVEGIEVAQAETPDAGRTDRLPSQAPVQAAAAVIPTEVTPNAENVVTLPAGIELDNLEFEVDGANLVLILADGTEIVVIGGAANIPTFVIGDLELPQAALFAALEGSNINVAAGPDGTFTAQGTPDASRNLVDNPIDAAPEDFALADLLEDTSFGDELRTGVILGADASDTEPTFLGATAGLVDDDFVDGGNLNDGANGNFSFRGSLGINWGPDNANGLGNTGLTLANDRGVAFTPATLSALAAQGYTSDGVALVYELSANGTVLTAYKDIGEGKGEEVFTVSVSDIATNGSYTFTLIGNLDHPDGQSENNIVIQFPFTAQDSDGSRASSSFSVTVNDDSPVQGETGTATLTEDNVSEYCATDDTPGSATKTDPISLGISWGADNDLRGEGDVVGRIVRFVAIVDDEETTDQEGGEQTEQFAATVIDNGRISDPASVGLSITGGTFTSEGLALDYVLTDLDNGGQTLTAYIVGTETKVFEIVLDPTATNGSATVEIFQELDHNVGSDSAIISVQFQATDSDGDAAKPATFSVTIQDDVLEIGRPEREFVDEDGYPRLETGAGNPGPWGHHSDDSNGGTSERGDLNISWGADDSNASENGGVTGAKGDRGVAFVVAAAPEGVTSNGFGLFYAYNATRTELVAYRVDGEGYFIDSNGERIPASSSEVPSLLSIAEAGEVTVEYLRLDDEGEFPADAAEQLTDAAVFEVTLSDQGSGSYTFTLLDNLDHRSQGEDNLDLKFGFTASDADGDEASSFFTVVVDDDTPVFSWFPEQEEVSERFIGETGDVERGNLYVSWGADNANNVEDGGVAEGKGDRYIVFRDQDAPRNLTSNGIPLTYIVSDNGTVLTAYRFNGTQYVGPEGQLLGTEPSDDARVFEVTLSDQSSGSYTFTLIDNLDHVGWGQSSEIDLKFDFKAVDSDGDVLNGSFEVDVRDGGPSLGGRVSSSIVDEEGIPGRGGNEGDSYTGKSGSAADASGTSTSTGNVALNINWGNDSDLKSERLGNGQVDDPIGRQVQFVDAWGNGVSVGTISSHHVGFILGQDFVGLKSGSQSLTYKIEYLLDTSGNWNGGYFLTASAGQTPVFTVTLDPTSETGSYKFDLLGVLNHPNGGKLSNSENDIDLTFRFNAIDSDGDATDVGTFKVTVDDDAPVAGIVVSGAELHHDETPGVDSAADDKSGAVPSIFNGLGVVIGWAQQAHMVSTSTSSYGADGGGSMTLALTQANGSTFNGVDSGLQNLAGQSIKLVSQNGLILGKIGGTVYFALSIDNDGTVSIAQYQPVKHDPNNSANDIESIVNVHVTVTVTDRDGDVKSATTSSPLNIKILDDGPSVATSDVLLRVVDEDGLSTAAPDSAAAIANGTAIAGSGSATTSVSVASLTSFFNFGADGAHATEAISLKAATNEPTGLTSQGKPILISVSSDGKTLTGTADGREVFTLKLNAQGTSYTFELKDQIDHPTLNNVASGSDGAFNDAENLLSSGTPSSLLDLSQFIVGKDGDGDTVTLTAGKFVIDVRDDIPTVTNAAVNVKIDTPEIVAPVEGKVANFVLVLDTSGSVTVAALKLQVTNFLSQLADSEAQDVRVHIVQFNNTASPVGTFDLIVDGEENGAAVTQALAAVNGLSGGGATNYEAGLLKAVEWIDGSNTLEVNTRSSAFDATDGSGYDQAYIIGNGSTQIAMVSGWNEPGNTVTDALNANGGNSNGWGVSPGDDANVDDGQILRFDFGVFNDFDGTGGFKNAENFDGVSVTSATFSLDDNNNSSSPTVFEYTVYFVGGGSATGTLAVNNNDTPLTIAGVDADLGKQIAYIEFTTSGEGRGSVDLESVTMPGPLLGADVNKVIFVSDGQPNAALDNDGDPFSTYPSNAISESLNEIGAIENDADGLAGPQQSFTIEAFGINVGQAALDLLNLVDSNDAENLSGQGALANALQGLLNSLAGTPGSAAPTSAIFNLSPLVSVGADEGLTFSLKSGTSGLPALKSGGQDLVYTVVNNTLTATAGENGPTVFTLSLTASGSGTFTLNKPIDGYGDKAIDFSSLIQAADFDGDAVSLAPGKFVVTVDGVPFGEAQSFEGEEDEAITGTIHAIIGSDGVGETGGYEIKVDPAHGTITSFNAKTGEFTFQPNENWNGTDSFTVTLKDDDGDESQPFVVTLNVAAVNDAPVITSGSAGSIDENAPASTIVYTAMATDVDGPSLTYSLGGDDADKFNIDQDGRVTFKTSPNFESPTDTGGNNVYDITVVASDGNVSAVKDVAITVNNVNEAPTAINFQSANASSGFSIEVARSSTQIVNLAAADALLAGTNQAAKQEANSSTVNFGPGGNFGGDSIFPSGGGDEFAVRATGTITITTGGTWTFGTHSDDGVRLKIDGQAVILDDAIHPGQNAFGQVYLTVGQHTIELVYFEHQGGELVELFAQAGAHSSWNDGFKLIGDVENGGLEVSGVLSIDENNVAGAVVATLTATDADAGDTHTFQLVAGEGDTDNARFTIVGNELRLIGSADYESQASYTIRVQATDAGGETYVTTKTIVVNDLVENTPATIGGVSTGSVTEDSVGSSQITYSEDFEAQSSVNGWTNGFRGGGFNGGSNEYVSENNFVEFDGQQSISKTLTLASAASETVIDFDFFKIDSWDQGEKLLVYLNDQVAFAFTPKNSGNDGLDGATGSFTIGGIAATYVITSSGFDSQLGGNGSGDRVYHVQITASGIGDQVKLGFGNNLDQSYTDEDFGIDNIVVHGNEPPALQAKGQLTINDPDAGEAAFVVQDNIDGTYGHFSIDADGTWTYVLDNGSSATQALAEGQVETDSFTVTSVDGTTHTVNVTVNGTNDAPVANNDIVLTNIVDGSPIYIPEAALLMNDQDVDNDDLNIISSGNAVNGTVSGTVAFDPTNTGTTILDANFNGNNANGFAYEDGRFGGQNPTDFATGSVSGSKLQVKVGDYSNERNNYSLEDRDGGWARSFTLAAATTVTIAFDYKLFISEGTDNGEFAQALFTIDGVKYGTGSNNYLAQLDGSNAGGALSADGRFEITLHLEAGTHELVLGAYINEFDTGSRNSDEYATAEFDNVLITGAAVIADGSFDYTVNDGIISDTGGVSIHAVAGGTITGTASDEILIAGDGHDILLGMDGDDYLSGNDGEDILNGGDGNDILVGGLGLDTMTGGTGADTFVFDETAFEDIDVTDVITDYSLAQGDMLDVSALLDSLLGESATTQQREAVVDTRIEGGNTFVTVGTGSDAQDIAMLNGVHDVKILFDDKHSSTIVHD